mmetsp:Transcript_10002/g.22793  ORF Transcript_10002/g.22793 Transcript_10002/m.22793 type:complete len:123 (-) Transcript_10002:37-405(-)
MLERLAAAVQAVACMGTTYCMGMDYLEDPSPALHAVTIGCAVIGLLAVKWPVVSMIIMTYFTAGLFARSVHPTLGRNEIAQAFAAVAGVALLLQLAAMFSSDDEDEEEADEKEKAEGKKKDK